MYLLHTEWKLLLCVGFIHPQCSLRHVFSHPLVFQVCVSVREREGYCQIRLVSVRPHVLTCYSRAFPLPLTICCLYGIFIIFEYRFVGLLKGGPVADTQADE